MATSTRPPLFPAILGIFLALLGVGVAGFGAWLQLLGGSAYYSAAGILMVVCGFLMHLRFESALGAYALLLAATLAWALWESRTRLVAAGGPPRPAVRDRLAAADAVDPARPRPARDRPARAGAGAAAQRRRPDAVPGAGRGDAGRRRRAAARPARHRRRLAARRRQRRRRTMPPPARCRPRSGKPTAAPPTASATRRSSRSRRPTSARCSRRGSTAPATCAASRATRSRPPMKSRR